MNKIMTIAALSFALTGTNSSLAGAPTPSQWQQLKASWAQLKHSGWNNCKPEQKRRIVFSAVAVATATVLGCCMLGRISTRKAYYQILKDKQNLSNQVEKYERQIKESESTKISNAERDLWHGVSFYNPKVIEIAFRGGAQPKANDLERTLQQAWTDKTPDNGAECALLILEKISDAEFEKANINTIVCKDSPLIKPFTWLDTVNGYIKNAKTDFPQELRNALIAKGAKAYKQL